MDKRHPLLPDAPTFKELGVNWVDGAFRGIGMPKFHACRFAQAHVRPVGALTDDPEMKELAAKSGSSWVNVGVEDMDALHEASASASTRAWRSRCGLAK